MMHSDERALGTEGNAKPPRVRRRWTVPVVVVCLLLLLVLLPPLLNVNRLRRRIATSMSASLGRPVHLDGVSLRVLPMPGFTLRNLVVSEDPAFGEEPVIRADTVEVTLRASSLWRRQVELADVHFVDPTLNLVRNAQGEWNLQSLLMHAAQVQSAPTAQAIPGPQPRFPYIEATGGRVNLKLGQEKQPFSLIDADFALWLPSAEQWRVRLVAKPVRTDINAADTGTVRLEGQLRRAATMAQVPVDLRMSWHDAPLGEASKLLSGDDAGWRGTLNVDATLSGPLSAASLATQMHVNGLRRADFVPVKLLDVDIVCNGNFDIADAVVKEPACTLPTPAAAGGKQAGQVVAIADEAELQKVGSGNGNGGDMGVHGLRLGMTDVADTYLLEWARLFSQRIPAKLPAAGTVAGSMTLSASSGAGWEGEFHGDLGDDSDGDPRTVAVAIAKSSVTMAPLGLMEPGKPPLTLSGEATRQRYTLHLAGAATASQLDGLRAMLPPLGDGLEAALPEWTDGGDVPLKLDVVCSRAWDSVQTCVNAAEPKGTRRR